MHISYILGDKTGLVMKRTDGHAVGTMPNIETASPTVQVSGSASQDKEGEKNEEGAEGKIILYKHLIMKLFF